MTNKIMKTSAILAATGLLIMGGTFLMGASAPWEVARGKVTKYDIAETLSSIDIDIEDVPAEVEIVVGDEFSISHDGDIVHEVVNGKSFVTEHERNSFIINKLRFFNLYGNEASDIIITIPSNTNLDLIETNIELSNVTIDGITATKMDLESKLGAIELNNFNANILEIETELGTVEADGNVSSSTDVSSEMGSVYLEGSYKGEMFVECEIGAFEASIDGSREDYYVMTENGLGTISIEGGNGGDSSAPNKISAKTNLGTIDIDFNK